MGIEEDLPLLYRTPPEWAAVALASPLLLLNDHAHLEKKAAGNALDMLARWPEPSPPENWVHSMTSIASDEIAHLQLVTKILSRRGGRLTKAHQNPYAAELRSHVRRGGGTEETLDRLLVSALIEARSCERFRLLGDHCPDEELARLYEGLYRSEAGHYRVFLALARALPDRPAVDARWEEFLRLEKEIIQRQPPGPTMHSGPAITH